MKQFSVLIFSGMNDIPGRALCMARCISHSPDTAVHFLSGKSWDPARFSRHVRSCYVVSGTGDDEWIEGIENAAGSSEIDIIFPVTSSEIRFASRYRERLQSIAPLVQIPETKLFDVVSDKGMLADFLLEKEICGPETITKISNTAYFMKKLEGSKFPVLLKHAKAGGGNHIQKFDRLEELIDFICVNPGLAKQSVIQEFISGYDIHCHVLCRNGKILAYTASENRIPGSREFGRPNCIRFIRDARVPEYLTKLIAALKWNGMAHLDLRFDERESKFKLIDFNPDWDDFILGALSAGINLPYLACLSGMDVNFPDPDISNTYFIRGKTAVRQGIKKIFGKDEIGVTFSETSWKYALHDPFSEIIRLLEIFFKRHSK